MAPPSEPTHIVIEIVCALPHRQFFKRFKVPAGTSLAQAVSLSGIDKFFSEFNHTSLKTGIHGKITAAETVLRQYDRVEIYRPLLIDPKEKRRLRSALAPKK